MAETGRANCHWTSKRMHRGVYGEIPAWTWAITLASSAPMLFISPYIEAPDCNAKRDVHTDKRASAT